MKVVPSSVFHIIDMTVINAWLLYRQVLSAGHGQVLSESMSLHDFKTRVTVSLCASTVVVNVIGRRQALIRVRVTCSNAMFLFGSPANRTARKLTTASNRSNKLT